MLEQKHTDAISEQIHAGATLRAYLHGKEFNPLTLVYYCPEMRDRIDQGRELFYMATGPHGVTTMPAREIDRIAKMIGEGSDWCTSARLEKAALVIDTLKQAGYRCLLTPEGLDAGMNQMKYYSQGPDDYLHFVLAFHNALTMLNPAND
jgi:hypothetical protein